jgi:hypothetical protein
MIEEPGGDETVSDGIKEEADDAAAKSKEAAAVRAALEAELRAIVTRAEEGDRSALPALRKALDEHPEYFRRAGDLALMAQESWLTMAAGTNLYARETIERKLAAMRRELAGPHPSPLENLTIDRILACWVQMHHADMLFAVDESKSEAVRKELLKRQESAQRRYSDAIKQLAQLRKLLQPASKGKKAESADPGAATAVPPQENCQPTLGVFNGAEAGEANEDPLARLKQELQANAASTVLEFPRLSKEQEADALLNGVGILN